MRPVRHGGFHWVTGLKVTPCKPVTTLALHGGQDTPCCSMCAVHHLSDEPAGVCHVCVMFDK